MADGGVGNKAIDAGAIASALSITKRAIELRAKKETWPFTEQAVRGGRRRLYVLSSLPADVQAAVHLASQKAAIKATANADQSSLNPQSTAARAKAAWDRYASAPQVHKRTAEQRLNALTAVDALVTSGTPLQQARKSIAAQLRRDGMACSPVSLWRWSRAVEGMPADGRVAALLPAYNGGTPTSQCDAQAWDWYSGHYLDRSRPTHSETYRRLQEMATAQGWTIPSADTLLRRMNAEVSRVTQTLRRDGIAAANKLLPTQVRDAMSFAVGEAINGDGIKFDRLWVKFEDGEILNTATAWVWQDIHSRRLLAWRVAKTENTDVFRLATYDLTGMCAPAHVWMDNTTVAANKLMTAGATGRHRFKTDPEEGVGLLQMLGMEPHFTNPDKETGNPGAKPIERAFGVGGLHELVATNPKIVAAGGFSKATAIDVALLREVVAQEVQRFNARTMRRTQACRGVLSFDQAWEAGLQERPPRVLSDAQRKLLLMCREVVRCDARNGELRIEAGRGPFGQNAYWCEHLPQHAGRKLAVHFDPDDLSAGAHVYSLDGRYLFAADHIPRGAFNDTTAGREHGKLRRRMRKSQKDIAANETRMTALERKALYASATDGHPPPEEPAVSTVVAGHFKQVVNPERDALRPARTGTDDQPQAALGDFLKHMQQRQIAERGWKPPTGD